MTVAKVRAGGAPVNLNVTRHSNLAVPVVGGAKLLASPSGDRRQVPPLEMEAIVERESRHTQLLKVARAVIARLMFIVHSLVAVYQAVQTRDNVIFWGFGILSVGIIFEGMYTVLVRAGAERKWFCPSVLLYILATCGPIWALEMEMSKHRLRALNVANQSKQFYRFWEWHQIVLAATGHVPMPTNLMANGAHEITSHLRINVDLGVQVSEQLLLVILIVARWILPKGGISREQLSQILLAYLAIASDIVELFDAFKQDAVVRHGHLQSLVLGCWFCSLLQFPFVLTVSKARKMRVALTHEGDDELKRLQRRAEHSEMGTLMQILHDVDVWAILIANVLQDIPFLVTRLILMFGYRVNTYTMIFFTCKNLLIIMLQTYRLSILIHDRYTKYTPEEDCKRLIHRYRDSISQGRHALRLLKRTHEPLFKQIDIELGGTGTGAALMGGVGAANTKHNRQSSGSVSMEVSRSMQFGTITEESGDDSKPLRRRTKNRASPRRRARASDADRQPLSGRSGSTSMLLDESTLDANAPLVGGKGKKNQIQCDEQSATLPKRRRKRSKSRAPSAACMPSNESTLSNMLNEAERQAPRRSPRRSSRQSNTTTSRQCSASGTGANANGTPMPTNNNSSTDNWHRAGSLDMQLDGERDHVTNFVLGSPTGKVKGNNGRGADSKIKYRT